MTCRSARPTCPPIPPCSRTSRSSLASNPGEQDMSRRFAPIRTLGVTMLTGMTLFGVLLVRGSIDAQNNPQAGLVRGNAHGEWRYWGADAWSTRYSALDQINATNFDKLQVAWTWNAAVDGI